MSGTAELVGKYVATPAAVADGMNTVLRSTATGEQLVVLADSAGNPVASASATEYETVAASQSDQILGATGAVGDYLSGILIVPETTGAGTVAIKDGNGSAINVFIAGTLPSLAPIYVPLGLKTINATTPGWKITTGANVHVIGMGNFT